MIALFILGGIVAAMLLILFINWVVGRAERYQYPGAPACPYCGTRHPLVAEFGVCGRCASTIYGNDPF